MHVTAAGKPGQSEDVGSFVRRSSSRQTDVIKDILVGTNSKSHSSIL